MLAGDPDEELENILSIDTVDDVALLLLTKNLQYLRTTNCPSDQTSNYCSRSARHSIDDALSGENGRCGRSEDSS